MGRFKRIPASIQELKKFLSGAADTGKGIGGLTRQGKLDWVRSILGRFSYDALSRDDKGVLKQYLEKTTGYSRAQMTRLIAESRAAIREASPVTKLALNAEMVRRPFAFAWTVSAAALTLLVMVRGWGGSTAASLTVLSGDLERRIAGIESELHGPRFSRILTERRIGDGSVALDPLLVSYEQIVNVDGTATAENFVALTEQELETKVEARRTARALEHAFGTAVTTIANTARDALQGNSVVRRAQRLLARGRTTPLTTQPIDVFPSYDVSNATPRSTPMHGSASDVSVARSNAIIDALGGGTNGQILMIENGTAVWRDMPFREQIRELSPHGDEPTRRGGGDGHRSGGGGGGSTATSTVTNTTTTIIQTIDSSEWTDGGTGVYLTTSTDYVIIGGTTPEAKLEVVGTVSGAILYAAQSIRSSGSLVWEGSASGASLWVSTLQGANLTDCDNATTSKLLWDSSTGRFSCGTDQGGSTSNSAGQGLSLNASNAFSLSNSFSGTALEIMGTASGRILHAQDQLRSSGSLIVQSTGLVKGNLSTRGTLSGAALTVMNGNSSFLGNLTIGSSATASEALEVIGTASGRILYATQTLRSSGSLVWEGSASGASLWVSQFQGAGLITTCDPTTGKLTWNSTTKSFVCGTDSGTSYTAGQGLTLSSTVFSLSPSFSGTALKILGTASGRILHAQDQLRSSGSLIVQSTGLFKGNLSTRGTLSGAALTVMNGNSYILGNFSIGTSASPDTALEVAGTMSGRTLTWAGGRSALDSGQGGNIELGGNGSVANPVTNGSPYIDFHFGNGSAEDYNTRIWNPADDRFDIINSNGGMIVLNDMRVGINTATPDTTLEIIGTASGRKLFAMDSLASSGNLVVSSLWKLGSGAIAALGAEYQTGAYLYASGASVLALESYTQNLYGGQHLAPNILFGYKGVFDTNLYRTSGSTLRTDAQFLITTSGSNVNRPSLLIDTETATGSRTVFLIKSNATSVDNRVFRINASGATFADQPYSSAGADYAEWFYDSGSLWGAQPLRSGEIVCIDIARNNAVRRCDKDADSNVMGIISTRPAFIGNHIGGADGVIPPGYVLVGLIGQLPAKALVASGATIRPGDALTAASIPGYARRARAGEPTVGVALEGLDVGEGTINVLVARTNSSLTVDAVEDKVLQTVAAMEIEDEIALAVNEAMNALDLESSVAAELQAQFSTLDLASRVETIVSRLDRQAGPDAELVSRFTALESVVQGLSGALVSLTSDAQMIQTADHSAAPTSFSGVTLSGRTEITGELIINGVPYGAAEPIAIASSDATQFVRIGTGGVVDLSALTVREALYVLGDVTIEGMAVFRGDVTIEGSLTLSGSLTVSGAIVMNSNQAGFALIPQGGTGVTVGFDPPFAENLSPVITVTSDSFSPHRLRASSATGFTIEVQQPAVAPIVFSWHALVTSDVRTHAGAPAIAFRLIPFPVDSLGVPLSSNTVWNACIRNQVQLDQDGQPFSCGRYHVDNIWTHPDLTIEFLWRPDLMPPLSLPEGFVETVVVSEERAEESAPVAPETLLDEATVIESSEAPAQGARGDHGADPEAQPSETDISPEDSVSSEDPAATTEDALSEQATDAPVEPATADEVAPSAEDAPLE